MRAEAAKTTIEFPKGAEVVHIDYRIGRLVVSLKSLTGTGSATVTFHDVAGFRVLDEGDLLEFWPTCSTPNGWLFRIIEGGWFAQESRRRGFLARETKQVNEYLVTGDDACVSVLSWSSPEVATGAL